MRKVHIAASIALMMVLCGFILWQVRLRAQPLYKGKPLEYWLQGYNYSSSTGQKGPGPHAPTADEANEAVAALGTNAIPVLLQMLQQENPKWLLAGYQFLRRSHLTQKQYPYRDPEFKAMHAFLAFRHGEASNAVPGLVEIMEHNHAPFPQQAAPAILSIIGPSAEKAIPMLLQAADHTNCNVRNNAIYALGTIHAQPERVVPVLARHLNDGDPQVQAQAAVALKSFGSQARAALPELVRLWKTTPKTPAGSYPYHTTSVSILWPPSSGTRPNVSTYVADAIKAIDPEAAVAAGIK